MVQRAQVDFSAEVINEAYVVPDKEGEECRRRMYGPTEEQVANALKLVALKGAEWSYHPRVVGHSDQEILEITWLSCCTSLSIGSCAPHMTPLYH